MRNLLISIFLLIFLFSNLAFSKNTKLDLSQKYKNRIIWKFMNYDLPDGEWVYYNKYHFSVSTIQINCISFIQEKLKNVIGHYEICEINNGGKHANLLGMYLNQELKRGKYDSCMLRPEYYYTKFWSKGMSMNCFLIRHVDVNKELNFPDDPEDVSSAKAKAYIKLNNLNIPKTMILSGHLYYSPNVRDKGISIDYAVDPEFYGAPKTLLGDEIQSEYHRSNINNYPEKRKFMENWLKINVEKHKLFEINQKARSHHKLDFTDISSN